MVLVAWGGGHGGLDLMIPVVSVFSPPNVAALMQAQRGLKNLLGVAEPDWISGPSQLSLLRSRCDWRQSYFSTRGHGGA